MNIKDLIEELKQKSIEITFSNGKLKYSGPEENVTPELLGKLKENKGKLIKYFWPHELSMVMPINTEGTKIPLFIIHGDYANYVISEHLGPDQPVYGFFHPGSEGEPIRYKNVKEMAAVYVDKVLKVFPTGPFYIMGFSFGGTLAYEMNVQLRKAGYSVPVLILLDSLSPLGKEPFRLQKGLIMILRRNILRPIYSYSKRLIKDVICQTHIFLGKPVPLERRADYIAQKYWKLTKAYSPEKSEVGILLFRTSENISSYRHLGWGPLARNIRIIDLEGKHLEIFNKKKNTEIVESEIEKCISEANNQS
jgi:thioesterase domain-containing protein